MLLLASLTDLGASASFGTDYRQLTATSGSTNTGTSIVISAVGATNYVVDPYTLLSTTTGTPSSSAFSGYGWRTAGAFGQSVPAGTWSFTVEVDNTGVALGTAIVRVYAYSTDIQGGNIDFIGTADSTNVLTTLASTQSRNMSFSASAKDLTNRVLVVEYWVIATNVSVATVTFHAVSTVASITVPTLSPTVFYLGTPQLYSAGLVDSFSTADSAARLYGASRAAADSAGVMDAINMQVMRSISDAVTVSGQVVTGTSRSLTDTLAAGDAISIAASQSLPEALPISDSISTRLSRSVSDMPAVTDSIRVTIAAARDLSNSIAILDTVSAKVTARNISDSLALTDAISAKITARAISDTMSIMDSIVAFISSRSVDDSLSVTDTLDVRISARATSDFLMVTDDVSAKIGTKAIADSLAVTDSIAVQVTAKAISDTFAVSDAIAAKVFARVASDSLAITDTLAASANFALADSVSVSDSIAISVTRSVQEILSTNDSLESSDSAKRSASDALAASDSVSMSVTRAIAINLADAVALTEQARTTALTINIADSLIATDIAKPTSIAINISDSLTMTDSARTSAFAIKVADSVAMTDNVAAASIPVLGDSITLADAISIQATRSISDSLSIEDSLGLPVIVSISDAVSVQDAVKSSKTITIADALGVNAQVTNLSVQWSRSFDETLGMADCTPFSCNQTLHLTENLALAGAIAPPPSMTDTISVGDSTIASAAHPANAGDSLGVSAAVSMELRPSPVAPAPGSPVPPLGVIVVSDRDSAALLPAAPVSGTYSVQDGDPALLYDQLQVPPQHAGAAGSPLAIVLPTYHVSVAPTPRLPTDDALLTVRMAEIPAGTPVAVPIDIAATPETADHKVSWIKIGYTPAVDSTSFGLAVSLLDTPPAGAQQQAGVTPMYVNIRWAGSFGAGTSPGSGSYYRDSPTLAFAITDGWATQNGVQRDENGVPVISLNLLDEATGLWRPVRVIDLPIAAVNGQYAYVAHLEHFSTYAITATRSGGHAAPAPAPPAIAPSTLSAHIAESLLVQDAWTGAAGRTPVSKAATLAENIRLSSSSDAYRYLDAGDVDIKMRVTSISPSGAFPPTAQVTLDAQLVNVGYSPKELVLGFAGDRQYHSSMVKVGAGESKNVAVQVPFGSPGTFGILAEVRSAGGELLDSTTFTVTVPWLDVYLYFLIVLQAILAAIIAAGIFVLLKYRRAWI